VIFIFESTSSASGKVDLFSLLEVPFPSSQRRKILVQLTSTSDETIEISQPLYLFQEYPSSKCSRIWVPTFLSAHTSCVILGFQDPLPLMVEVDSRCFDISLPPNAVACIDLDTNSIYLSESKSISTPNHFIRNRPSF
jgi:hypothetical protein